MEKIAKIKKMSNSFFNAPGGNFKLAIAYIVYQ
jgi:hypothetical protein